MYVIIYEAYSLSKMTTDINDVRLYWAWRTADRQQLTDDKVLMPTGHHAADTNKEKHYTAIQGSVY